MLFQLRQGCFRDPQVRKQRVLGFLRVVQNVEELRALVFGNLAEGRVDFLEEQFPVAPLRAEDVLPT